MLRSCISLESSFEWKSIRKEVTRFKKKKKKKEPEPQEGVVRRRIWAPALLQKVHSGESRTPSRGTHLNSALGAVQGPTLGGGSRNEKWEEDK